MVNCQDQKTEVKATPFKISNDQTPITSIIEQNNFTNESLHVIGQQLDCIEEKIVEDTVSISEKFVFEKIEEPLTNLSSQKEKVMFKTSQSKMLEVVDKMLSNLKIKIEGTSRSTTCTISKKEKEIVSDEHTNSDTISSVSAKEIFSNDFPEIKRFVGNPKPMSFTKNWYSKPIPPDIQFKERIFQPQFPVSTDKLYKWNITGLFEQKIMSHMSEVGIAYQNNHDIDQPDIVNLLVTGFSGTLHEWWDSYPTSLPIFSKNIGCSILDDLNTPIYSILKYFVGTPNISPRVSDLLKNLRCSTMTDYKWYQDVFLSRIMLRKDCHKPYWKEKLIDGLPPIFAYKVKQVLMGKNDSLNYDNLTYDDIFSAIIKFGTSMCNNENY